MNDPKTWLILGADAGLGPGAVKYLISQGHKVFGLPLQELSIIDNSLGYTLNEHPLDYIINNSNYYLFAAEFTDINSTVEETVRLVNAWTPLLNKTTAGSIINLPPQLCISALADRGNGPILLQRMDYFLNLLHRELKFLPYNLHFINPGERVMQF